MTLQLKHTTIHAPRPVAPTDVEAVVAMIRELAVFERLEHLVTITPNDFQMQLFGPNPVAQAVMVDALQDDTAVPIAFALYFHNFSTFLGKPGLYLEDLYVKPAWRGLGVGKGLLRHLGQLAVQRGCGRFEWSVLDWNKNAIAVYQAVGAVVMDDWRICRVTGDALVKLAQDESR